MQKESSIDVKNIEANNMPFEDTNTEQKIEYDDITASESMTNETTNQTMYAANFKTLQAE